MLLMIDGSTLEESKAWMKEQLAICEKRKNGNGKKKTRIKICIVCNESFETLQSMQKICSEKCRQERKDLWYNGKMICLECGLKFTSTGKNKICSKQCKKRRLTRKWNEFHKRNPEKVRANIEKQQLKRRERTVFKKWINILQAAGYKITEPSKVEQVLGGLCQIEKS